jgi:hypothetical protein
MSATAKAPQISRRRLLAGSGAAVAAPVLLAACGTTEADDRSTANDPALLNSVLAQHLAVLDALRQAQRTDFAGDLGVGDLISLREDSAAQLASFVEKQGGTPTKDPAPAAQAESAPEGLALQLGDSIEASLAAIGDISVAEFRQAIHRSITEDAAVLAALRSVTGGEVAPDSFVFGTPAATGSGS